MPEFIQTIYEETFQSVYSDLLRRKLKDSNFDKGDLEGLLNSYYANEGNNWVGQSEIKQIRQAATIAACEAILSTWE